MTLTELADRIDMTLANLSILKTGKARAIRFSTLEAICGALSCQPGDLLQFESEEQAEREAAVSGGQTEREPMNAFRKKAAAAPTVSIAGIRFPGRETRPEFHRWPVPAALLGSIPSGRRPGDGAGHR